MKRMAYFAFLAMAVSAVIAAPASATVLTSPTGTEYTGAISLAAGEVTFHGAATHTCSESGIEAEVSQHGASVTASGKVTKLTFSGCWPMQFKVLKLGEVIIHTDELGTGAGTVTLSGTEFEASDGLNICTYRAEGTDVSEFTLTGFGFFCGLAMTTGKFSLTQPSSLYVD